MRKLLKSFAFTVLAICLIASAAGCSAMNRYILDSRAQESVKRVGLDPKHPGMRIEQIYDDYEMGDGVTVYKLSFSEKASELFKEWNELTKEDEQLRESLYLAKQAWVSHGIEKGKWIIIDRASGKPASYLMSYTAGVYDAEENIAYIVENLI